MSKFLTVFCGLLLFASSLYAQDNKVYIGENDTIRYSYTPLQTDSIPASQPSDTLAAAPKKKSVSVKKSPSPKAGWGRKRQKKSLALFGRVFPESPVVRHAKLAKIPDRFLKS
jgi:hypothetical protein